jgi:hypothetical protein
MLVDTFPSIGIPLLLDRDAFSRLDARNRVDASHLFDFARLSAKEWSAYSNTMV